MASRPRILIVDDEKQHLGILEQLLPEMAPDWQFEFADGGTPALRILSETPCDVIVTDFQMPGMNGLHLLQAVRERYPRTIRILLSGQSDKYDLLRMAGTVHQHLTKPCSPTFLKETVSRNLTLRNVLHSDKLQELVSQTQSLPSIPHLYLKLLEELQNEDPSAEEVAHIISQDLGMCSKMLQLANSAFFGFRQPIASPMEMVIYLGMETVKSLVLYLQIFSTFQKVRVKDFSFQKLWSHSWQTGVVAKKITEFEVRNVNMADESFVAGLLHDVGKLVLATRMPDAYNDVVRVQREKKINLCEAEMEVLGSTHAEVGGYLLGLWGLPNTIVESVALHHKPSDSTEKKFSLITAIHVGNALSHETRGKDSEPLSAPLDMEHLAQVGMSERMDVWRELLQIST